MVGFPLVSINGYWNPKTQICTPAEEFTPAPPPAEKKPLGPVETRTEVSAPAPKIVAVKAERSFLSKLLFGEETDGAVGCGVAAPSPLCESNNSPRIFSAIKLFDSQGKDVGFDPVKGGEAVRLKVMAKACDDTTDGISVSFLIDGVPYAAQKGDDGYFYLDHTFAIAGQYKVIARVSYQDAAPVEASREVYVEKAVNDQLKYSFKVYAKYDPEDGAITHRPVNLELNNLDSAKLKEINWEIRDPEGNHLPEDQQPLPGMKTGFTPEKEGYYSFTVKIKYGDSPEDFAFVTGALDRPIGPFLPPKIEFDGNFYPQGNQTAKYNLTLVKPDWRDLGSEDDYPNATCTFKVYQQKDKNDPSKYLVNIGTDAKHACDWVSVPLPYVAPSEGSRIYILEASVNAPEYNHAAVKQNIIYVQAATAGNQPKADFVIPTIFEDRVAYKPIQFNANDFPGAVSYNWEVIGKNYTSLPAPIPFDKNGGKLASHTFESEGLYTVRLTLLDADSKELTTVDKEVEVYKYPVPEVELEINDQNPVHTGDTISIVALFGSSSDAEAKAGKEFKLYGSDGKDVTPALCPDNLKDSSSIKCSFSASGTYKVLFKLVGKIDYKGQTKDAYTVEKASFINVYPLEIVKAASDVTITFPVDGAIPLRTFWFKGSVLGLDPQKEYEHKWSIEQKDGQPYAGNLKVEPDPTNPQIASLIFEVAGLYVLSYKIFEKGKTDLAPLVSKSFSVNVSPFPKPQLEMDANGNTAIHKGDPVVLTGYILRNWAEDATAKMSWKVSVNGKPVNCAQNANGTCSLTPATSGTYVAELSVEGTNGSYSAQKIESFDVWEVSQAAIGADFLVIFPKEGAIPFREYQFTGTLTNPSSSEIIYKWSAESKKADGSSKSISLPDGQSTSFTPTEAGIYLITVNASKKDGGEAVASKSASLMVNPFPIPEVSVDINGNLALYAENAANFSAMVLREWPEDIGAAFKWTFSHLDGSGSEVSDGGCEAKSCSFLPINPGTYLLKLTVTGKDGVYSIIKIESASVYKKK